MTALLHTNDPLWMALGMIAQLCFFLRFLVQWLASEARKESVIPVSFWYLSMAGCLGLLAYSIHKGDPVFIIGQSTGMFIYARNLHFVLKKKTA
ncbi:MAG TPA: lipid-A-disaccharide synthase N-terminal domain-containing protein [Elusimicrobiota bacterium]|jgi:lipid-A-disaccharide synthase-like uncharacterized protein|nr:lipid-A-disaccharide synthase N-terminal domain-containing protein [Elusimicrobiota bacterium]